MSNKDLRRGPVVLVVLDGWGYRAESEANAIALGETPNWRRLWDRFPRTLLQASGRAVGLPEGQMGNSEVGHLNLGAGRVVPQDLVRISDSMADGAFFRLEPIVALAEGVRRRGATLHLAGLLGPGGVHAIDTHLRAALELATRFDLPRVAVHGFLDGRDSPPTSALEVVRTLAGDIERLTDGRGVLATLTGRYYAMDRDRRWDRTRLAWDAMVHGVGVAESDPVEAVAHAYARGETDEFVRPIVLRRDGGPAALVRDGDGLFCFNYRSDRMRQILGALAVPGFDGFDVRGRPSLDVVTMTQYDQTFPFPVAFPPVTLSNITAEVLAGAGRSQLRTAETEKYPHVTYFFNGGNETPVHGEVRELVPSPKVATYDLQPEMSAVGVTDVLCRAIERREHDFILCNYANADMVGHTGVMEAVLKAVGTVDACLGRVVASAERASATLLVTADHGNAELMVDPATGGPHTAHTTNPVPLVLVGTDAAGLREGGALCDVGPTALHLLGLTPPPDMTGRDLRIR